MTIRSLTQPFPSLDVLAGLTRRRPRETVLTMPRAHGISANASFLLDVVRFAAAVMVVAAHLTHLEFPTGFREHQVLGDIAVPIFFVLSGFVIRSVTRTRPSTLRGFLIDRAARMYSVMLPAMALTLAVAAFSYFINPHYYQQHWSAVSDHPLSRVALNLTFLSQTWGRTAIPLVNSPFWSLSYEFLFYIAYGLFFYLRGWRRCAALAVWAAVAGPQILFLLPTWALGCALYEVYYRLRRTHSSTALLGAAGGYFAVALTLLASGQRTAILAPIRLHRAAINLPNPLVQLHLATGRATMMALATGLLAAVTLLLLVLLADLLPAPATNGLAVRFRSVADGTFAIYLMHYPLLVLAASLTLFRPHQALLNLGVATGIIVLLIAAADPCDRLKDVIRRWLNAVAPQTLWFPVVTLSYPAPRPSSTPLDLQSSVRAS